MVFKRIEDKIEAQRDEVVTIGAHQFKTDRVIAGQGKYIMANEDQSHTSIKYELESSCDMVNIEKTFNVATKAEFYLAVKCDGSKWLPGLYEIFFL